MADIGSGNADKYSASIEQNASLYGYKAANLIELQELVQEFNASDAGQRLAGLYDNKIAVEVPKFLPLDGNIIAQHLDENSPKWREK
jgi:hypothetical protein